jgi:hypothetical protein
MRQGLCPGHHRHQGLILNPLYSEELKFFLNRFSPNPGLTDFAATLTTSTKQNLQDAANLRPQEVHAEVLR